MVSLLPIITTETVVRAFEAAYNWLSGIVFELFVVTAILMTGIAIGILWVHFISERVEGQREVRLEQEE